MTAPSKHQTRRGVMLGTIAAVATPTLPALAQVDPIYGAIERHRDAYARYFEARRATDYLWESEPPALSKAIVANREARAAFAAAQIVTPAGAAAALRYLLEEWDEAERCSFLDDEMPDFFEHLADALARMDLGT